MIYGPLSEALLDGRYRVGEVIGTGGFGTVYAAYHLGLEAKVAIKVPRVDDLPPSAIPEAIATFLEEGRTLKRLRHSSLVSALDVALLPPDERGLALPYLVLEWCEGPTLKAWRAERPGQIPAAEAWELLRPAFLGIAHAHDEGIAHRDLKPANILLETSRDGVLVPRVIDFGIAKILGASDRGASGFTRTTSEHRAFTPRYAAPEQLTGMRSGPPSDVYALALLLLEVIRGEPVFSSDEDARRAVVDSDPPTPGKLGLDLGPWNEHVARALSARASDRFPDAGAFVRALDGETPEASRPARGPRPTPVPHIGSAPPAAVQSAPHAAPPATDDSVVPSSHTLRTLGARTPRAQGVSAPAPRAALVLGGGAALLFAVFVVLILFVGGGYSAIQRMQVRPPAASRPSAPSASAAPSTSAGPSTSAPVAASGSAAPASPPRPLLSLTARDLQARIEAAGLTRCQIVLDGERASQVVCAEGFVSLADHREPLAPVPNRVWKLVQEQARSVAVGGKAARFTVDGEVGLTCAAPPAAIGAVTDRLLEGVRHEDVGEIAATPETIAPRLAEWKGPELAVRIRALGGVVQSEAAGIDVMTVLYTLDGKDAFAAMTQSNAKSFLATTRGPYAFAVDQDVAILVKGDGDLGRLAHLQKILDKTTAARLAEQR